MTRDQIRSFNHRGINLSLALGNFNDKLIAKNWKFLLRQMREEMRLSRVEIRESLHEAVPKMRVR